MKLLIQNLKTMPREDASMMLVVLFASLLGLGGTAVFLNQVAPTTASLAGSKAFLVSIAATLIYSGVMGLILYLLHPKRGVVYNWVRRS